MAHRNQRLREIFGGESFRYFCIVSVNTLLFFLLYRVLISYGELTGETFYSFIALVVYSALLLAFTLAYLIYNRFLWRSGITVEQLPDTWSEERKQDFVEDAKRRLKKSKWMLTVIFPLLVTFFFDSLMLFVIEPVFGISL
jgi:hypothetical protein